MLNDEQRRRPRSGFRRVVGALAIAIPLIASVSGCAAGAATNAGATPASAIPANSQTPSSTPTPTPTPTVVSSDPATWTIDFDGVGPFSLGGSVSAAKNRVGPAYTLRPAESCPNPAMSIFASPAHPTLWVAADVSGSDEIKSVFVGGDASIDVRADGSPQTDRGVGVGTPVAQLTTEYPSAVLDSNAHYGPVYILDDPANASDPQRDRHVLFGTRDNVVTAVSVQSGTKYAAEFCG